MAEDDGRVENYFDRYDEGVEPQGNYFDQYDEEHPLPDSSMEGTAARGVARGLFPAGGGAAAGFATGAAVSAVASPWVGVPAGIAVGLGAGELLNRGQQYLLDKTGLSKGEGLASSNQELADQIEHPYTKQAGEIAPGLALLKPTGALSQRIVGGGIGGVVSIGDQLVREGEVDPWKTAEGVALGAAFPTANRAGRAVENFGTSWRGAPAAPGAPPAAPGAPPGPQPGTQPGGPAGPNPAPGAPGSPQSPLNGTVIPPKPKVTPANDPTMTDAARFAYEQRDLYTPDDPLWGYWNDHAEREIAHGAFMADPARDVDASLGPRGDENPFTYQHSDRANDVTTVASGVAAENYPTALIEGAGNPHGAPMQARIAARPRDPTRSYPKDDPWTVQNAQALADKWKPTQESVPVSQAPIHEDIQAALSATEPQRSLPPPDVTGAVTPHAPEPPRNGEVLPSFSENRRPQTPEEADFSGWIKGERQQQDPRQQKFQDFLKGEREKNKNYGHNTRLNTAQLDTIRRQGGHDITGELAQPQRALPAPTRPPAAQAAINAGGKFSLKRHVAGADATRMKFTRGQREVVPEKPVPPKEYVPRERPAPVREQTPAEPAAVQKMRASLQDQPEHLARFNAMPAEQKLRVSQAMETGTGRLAENERLEGHRKSTEGGAKASSAKDAARKDAALKAVKDTVEYVRMMEEGKGHGLVPEGTSIEDNKGAIISHATHLFEHAVKLHGGTNPTDRTLGYQPAPKFRPPEWNVVKAAGAVIKNPGNSKVAKEAREAYVAALDLKGEVGENVDADLAMRKAPSLDDPDMAGVRDEHASSLGEEEQVSFKKARIQPGKDNTFAEQYNELIDYVHSLSPDEWHQLSGEYGNNVSREIEDVGNPLKLLKEFRDTLEPKSMLERSLLARFGNDEGGALDHRKLARDVTGAVRAGAARAAMLTHHASQKDYGALVKEATNAALRTPLGKFLKKGPAAEALRADNARKALEMDYGNPATDPRPPRFMDTLEKFYNDESGAMTVPKFVNDAFDWVVDFAKSYKTPKVVIHDAIREYAADLGDDFNLLNNRITEHKARMLEVAKNAKYRDGTRPSEADRTQMYLAKDRGKLNTLPQHMRDYWNDHYVPLETEYASLYDNFRRIMRKNQFLGWDDLPVRKNNGPGYHEWIARMTAGKQAWDRNDVDPLVGHASLSTFAQTGQERDWFSLQNGPNGHRVIYQPDNGFVTIKRNGAPSPLPFAPGTFDPKEIGSVLRGKTIDGIKGDWTVDHAGPDEITAAAGKDPITGKNNVEYITNPMLAMQNALLGLKHAYENAQVYDKLVNSQVYKTNHSRNPKDRKDKGWTTTTMPQFHGVLMPEPIAWALDDHVMKGFGHPDNQRKLQANKVSQNIAKLFLVTGAPVHINNEFDKFIIGRGHLWVTPTGWGSLGRNLPVALRSVYRQDALQHEIREAGGNPMLMHTLTRNITPRIARILGEDITKHASDWDPIAKKFNTTTGEVLNRVYDTSSAGMWWATDAMYTTLYLENKQLYGVSDAYHTRSEMLHSLVKQILTPANPGAPTWPARQAQLIQRAVKVDAWLRANPEPGKLSRREVVEKVERVIDSYRVPTEFGFKGKDGKGSKVGRGIQKFLMDPLLSYFPAYHYGLFKSVGHMTSDLLGPQASMATRGKALAQWAVALGMIYGGYDLISKGVQQVTGDSDSKLERRGVSRLLGIGKDIATGDKDIREMLRNVWTPSVPVDTAQRLQENRDFANRPIWPSRGVIDPRQGARTGLRLADFLAGQMVSPYKAISTTAFEKGSPGAKHVASKFLQGMVGVKTRSAAQQKWDANKWKRDRVEDKRIIRNPRGLGDYFGGKI